MTCDPSGHRQLLVWTSGRSSDFLVKGAMERLPLHTHYKCSHKNNCVLGQWMGRVYCSPIHRTFPTPKNPGNCRKSPSPTVSLQRPLLRKFSIVLTLKKKLCKEVCSFIIKERMLAGRGGAGL